MNKCKAQSANQETVGRFYRPELDCLRFFAFFAVYICHTLPGDAASYAVRHVPVGKLFVAVKWASSCGVDLFFLLSAYLITELLLREVRQFGKLDLRSFYIRRILRIWPLYFLGILIGVLLPLVDSKQRFPLPYALAFVFMFGNLMVSLKGVFPSAFVALWSVSFEEQFYLLWPAVIKKTRGNGLLWACAVLLAIATVSRVILLGRAISMDAELTIWTNTLTRLDPLALGIATAVLLHGKRRTLNWAIRLALIAAGLALWLVAGWYYSCLTLTFMLFGYPAIALGAWLIFMAALGSALAPRWLRYLGKISYGLYVFHGLALYSAGHLIGGIHTIRTFVVHWWLSLALTVAMAAISYRYFESPFLRLKDHFARVKSRPV